MKHRYSSVDTEFQLLLCEIMFSSGSEDQYKEGICLLTGFKWNMSD